MRLVIQGKAIQKECDLDNSPISTIMRGGIDGVGMYQCYLKGKIRNKYTHKYAIPTMSDINAIAKKYTVASTFAGCGGSSTGYKMAGLDVVWANEFEKSAYESYKKNHATFVNVNDIKTINAHMILSEAKVAEIDILDGSPPCQAFSIAGKRNKGWGNGMRYSNGIVQNNEDLFWEYIRILKELQPKIFIAENVTGLIVGAAKGMFLDIMDQMKSAGYIVDVKILDAQYLNVPQVRRRIIFMGVRADLHKRYHVVPVFPKPNRHIISFASAVWDLQKNIHADTPLRRLTIQEIKRACSFPDDYIVLGSYATQWGRLGNSVPPVMMYHIAKVVKSEILDKIPQKEYAKSRGKRDKKTVAKS